MPILRALRRRLATPLLPTLLACSSPAPAPEPDGGTPDAGPQPTCLERATLDRVFALDPDGPDTQIHPSVAYDGEAIWVAWNRPDETNGFDVWLARLRCDGVPLVAPFRANTTTPSNDVDPDLAVRDGAVYLAWASDSRSGANNMDVRYRTFALDGAPVMAADRALDTTRQGIPEPGNVMSPVVAALPGGGFAIAGQRGISATTTFQVFVQRLALDGTLDGEAVDGYFEDRVSQLNPALAADDNGALHLAWLREDATSAAAVYARVDASGGVQPRPPRTLASGATVSSVSVAAAPGGQVLLAWAKGEDVFVQDAGAIATPLALGAGTGADYAPRVLATADGGAVFWHRRITGTRGDLRAQPFQFDGSFAAGEARAAAPNPVAAYAPAATHVEGNTWFVAWSEGTSPALRIRGQFVALPWVGP